MWMCDGEFCGEIGFRWQPGTTEQLPYCLGHIGYSVVPWKRRLDYATQALRDVLPEAIAVGLPHVDLTCEESNVASRKVIEANRGRLVGRWINVADSRANGTVSPSHRLTVSPSHRLTVSPSHRLTVPRRTS